MNTRKLAKRLIEAVKANNDGVTLTERKGKAPGLKTGYYVGGAVPTLETTPSDPRLTERVIDWLTVYRPIARERRDYLGGWVAGGRYYFDVSTWVPTLSTALELGAARGELEVYDIARGVSILVPR